MDKEFVPYEQALELKELGFHEPCFAFYQKEYIEIKPIMVDDDNQYKLTGYRTCANCEIPAHYVSAPTYSQAFRWFRDKYFIYSNIWWVDEAKIWAISTTKIKYSKNRKDKYWSDLPYSTYEKAELQCLKKIIEIVKKNAKVYNNRIKATSV